MFGRATNIAVLLLVLVMHDVHQCCGQLLDTRRGVNEIGIVYNGPKSLGNPEESEQTSGGAGPRNLDTPHGVNKIGIGYNIIYGNPEGSELTSGGVDPGLLVSRRIFELSYDDNKLSDDNQYLIPDEVYFTHRSSAYTSSFYTTFYSESSYASELSAQVDVSGSFNLLFASVEFSASARYGRITNRMSTEGTVFFTNQTITNLGHVRYLTELAQTDGYKLNRGFVADACSLPNSYNADEYRDFLDDWGTHVVTEVDLGIRAGTTYEETRSSFLRNVSTEFSSSLSASGSVGIFSASVAVNVDTFNSAMESGRRFGRRYSSYTVGSASMNEPISLQLIGMHEVFEERFWTQLSTYIAEGYCSNSFQLSNVGDNILTAMQAYADSVPPRANDPGFVIPLTWPVGTYGLPEPDSGCPNSQYTWFEGYRFHDTENHPRNRNYWSSPLNLKGSFGLNDMKHYFCIKTTSVTDINSSWLWQPGSYCIYKYGACPSGFTEGSIFWDDENFNNRNYASPMKPDGDYDHNTKMYFCCRNDAPIDREIFLPTDDSFMLFPRFNGCQAVNGMTVTQQWFQWNTQDGNNWDSQSAVHPYEGRHHYYQHLYDIQLHFCLYRRQ